MTLLKKCLPDVLAVLLFAVLAFTYFFPADIEGRILYRHDASAGRGAGQEGIEYLQKTGERSRWTNALFGGMPTYQMAPSYGSTNLLTKAVGLLHPAACLRLPSASGSFRLHHLGLLHLFPDYHRSRPYLEGMGTGLSAADDCRSGAGL